MFDLMQLIPTLATGMEILTGVSIGLALLGLGAGIYMVLTAQSGFKGKQQSFDDFSITGAQEGSPVPMIFGKVRLPGNIIYWGNLQSHDVKEKVSSLWGSERVVVGFAFSIDMWQAICEGPDITLHGAYYNDKWKTIDDLFPLNWTFNDGSGSFYPTPSDAPYINAINPIAHFWTSSWFLEVNAYTLGNVEWLVSRDCATGLTDENLSNGANPAAVIYEMLERAGAIPTSEFVLSSFDDAATEWSSRGYGLNIKIQQHTELRELLLRLRDYVDFSLYQDKNNQWVLTAWKDGESSVADLTEADYISFKFKRTTHHKCYSKFTARIIDEDQEFTDRIIGIRATHLPELLTYEKPLDVDLSAFRDADAASRRLMEIVRQHSFPFAEIEITTNLTYMDTIYPGNVITITNDDYDYVQTKFRVLDKNISEIDKNELGFTLRQIQDGVYTEEGYTAGGSYWEPPDTAPYEAPEQAVYELPYIFDGSQQSRYMVLVHRQTPAHTAYDVYISTDDSDYSLLMTGYAWSCHANLDVQYSSATDYIDEDVGITITPTSPELEDVLVSVSRAELFEPQNICLIDDELMSYQTVTDLGGGQYRLTGVIRGLLNTTIATHTVDSDVWLFNITPDQIAIIPYGDFYIKIVPYVSPSNKIVTVDDVTAIHVTSTQLLQTPWPVSRIEVVKSGSTNDVTVWPTSKVYTGAGAFDGDVQTDNWPPSFEGEILHSIGSGYTAETSAEFSITQAGGFTLSIIHRRNGRSSSVAQVVVGSGDGTYVGPNV